MHPNMNKTKSKILSALCLSLLLVAQAQATPPKPMFVYQNEPIAAEQLIDKYIKIVSQAKSDSAFEITPFKLDMDLQGVPRIKNAELKYLFGGQLGLYEAFGITTDNIGFELNLSYENTASSFMILFKESTAGFRENVYCPISIDKLEEKIKNAGFFQLSNPEKLAEESKRNNAEVYTYIWGKYIDGKTTTLRINSNNNCLQYISFPLKLKQSDNQIRY